MRAKERKRGAGREDGAEAGTGKVYGGKKRKRVRGYPFVGCFIYAVNTQLMRREGVGGGSGGSEAEMCEEGKAGTITPNPDFYQRYEATSIVLVAHALKLSKQIRGPSFQSNGTHRNGTSIAL